MYIYMLSSWFLPRKARKSSGPSRNESDCSRRGTQTSFPLLESRSCEIFGLAHFTKSREKKVTRQSPHFAQLSLFSLDN